MINNWTGGARGFGTLNIPRRPRALALTLVMSMVFFLDSHTIPTS